MSYQEKMTAPGKLGGRTRSQDTEPFFRAVRTKAGYPNGGAKSSGGIPIFTDDGRRGVCAGYLHADGTFCKSIKTSHILQKPQAIAIQSDVLQRLACQGCHTIDVTLLETGKVLKASLRSFGTHGIKLNRGYGLQVALPLSQWKDADDPQGSLFEEVTR